MADPIPEGWTEEPVVGEEPLPEGWTEEPLPEGWTEEPVETVPTSAQVPAGWGFTAQDISNEVSAMKASELEAKRQARNTRLRLAFDEARRTTDDDAATTVAIARKLQVPFDTVRANLPAFRETAAAAQFDPEAWATQNPELAKLVTENPDLGPLVLRSQDAGPIVRALRSAGDFLTDALGLMSDADIADQERFAKDFSEDPDAAMRRGETLEQDARVRQELARAKRDAPRQVWQRDDARARLLRESSDPAAGALILWQRGVEAKAALDRSRKQVALMLAENGLRGDASELSAQLADAELAGVPRAFGDDSGVMRDLAEAMQGAASTLDVAGDALAGASAGAAIGFAAGAAPTFAMTKSVSASIEAGMVGARALGGKGASAAAFLSATQLETGASYEALRELETDQRQRLSAREAMGGAVIQGLAKGALEVISLGQQGQVLRQALPGQITGLLKRDPTFRSLVAKVAGEYGKSILTEGLTEGLQDAVEQVGDYLSASLRDGALQRGPLLELDRTAQAFQGGVLGAALSGSVTSGLALATTRTAEARAEVSAKAVGPLLELADVPAVKAAPQEFARLVGEATGENGPALQALHVDAAAVVKYFQDKGEDLEAAGAQLAELIGPEAPAQLAEAVAAGGKLEVPMEAVLSRWGSSEVGKALVGHTTTDPGALTPEQKKAQQAEIEARAEAVVQDVEAQQMEAEQLAERTRALEAQLMDAGMGKQQAKAGAALVRAFMVTQAKDFGAAVSELFPEAPISVAKGDEAVGTEQRLSQAPSATLTERARTVDVATRARELFTDDVSGLRTRRAWDASPRKPGTQVAVITSPDIKALNDDPKGGHDTANELLRLIGGVVGGIDAEAARSGTNFLIHAKNREQLRAAVNAVRSALPQGLTVIGAVAPTVDEAFTKLDVVTAEQRSAGKLAERGKTAFDLSQLGADTFAAGKAAAPNVSAELLALAERTSGEAYAREAYFDRDVPGVLSKTGFDALPPSAFVSAFDLKGLKRINDVFGKPAGNAILRAFGEAAVRAGGEGVAFAHLSGDEYAAKHDDRAKLAEFENNLRVELQKVGVSVMFGGAQFELVPDFRSGTGEKTYGAADRDLNARKRAEAAAANDVQRVRGPDGEAPGDQGRAAGGDGGRQAGLAGTEEVARLKQDTGTAPKGYTELPAGRALQSTIRVFLNKSADVSTVIHESGHAFLEQLGDLAERPDAPQRTKDTYAAALKVLGVDQRRELKREHHEKFARAFEKYVFEGQAPSAALKQVFARFTSWLVRIYRTLSGIPELSAELKPVFDAILATDEQLAAMRRKQGPQLTAEQLQVKQAERQAQLEQEADEYREGSHAAQLAAVKDALRLREKWWKDGLKKLEANFAEEYEQLPARRAQRLISGEETGEPIVLDRALVQEVIGELRVPGLKTADTGGVRPSVVAEMAGYASPRAMLADLAGLRSQDTWVRAQADAEMRRLHPGILDDLSKFRALLADGLRSATEKRLMREVAGLDREALKRAAEKLVARRKVGKLQPGKALAQQRQAANAKARAMAKGDANAVREAATAELLNHFLHGELTQAAAEVEKVEALAKRLGKSAARERLGKASPAYRDAVDFIRGELGFGEQTNLTDAALEAALGQLEGDAVTIGDPDWLAPLRAAIAKTGDYRELTVAELEAVRDALKMLETGARNRTTVLLDGKRVEKDAVLAALAKEASENKVPAPAVNSTSPIDLARRLGSALTAPLLKIETMTDWLGGALVGKNPRESMWHRAVYRPLEGARQREADLQARVATPILNAWKAMPAEMRDGQNDLIDPALFPEHGVPNARQKIEAPSRRYELLMMGLNAGNESNLDRLLRGRNITREQLQNALNLLTKEEVDWINAVGEAFEGVWPEIQELEERLTGIKPEGVKKQPLQLRNGTIAGHYFPALYDARIAGAGPTQNDQQIAELFHPSIGRPATTHGHTKARVEGHVGVIALEPSVIPVHLAQHIHDLAFREAIGSVGGLLLDKGTQDALYAALGPDRGAQFKAWLRDAARVQGIEGAETAGWTIKLMQKAKANLTVSAIGYSAPNFFEDLSGIVAALFDRELSQRHWAAGLLDFYRNPLRAWRSIETKSKGVSSSVGESLMRDLTNELKTLKMSPNAVRRLGQKGISMIWDHAFVLIEASFKLTAGPIWMGRYRQELDAGGSEAAAVEAADAIVRRLFASHSPVNAAGIIRNKFIGGFIQFYGFFNTAANKTLDEWQRVLEAPRAAMKLRAAGRAAGYMVAIGIIGAVLKRRGPRDEQPPEEWAMWTMLNTVLAQVPFGSDAANLLEAKVQGRRGSARPTLIGAMIAAGVDAVDVFNSDREDWARAKAALRTAGLAGGLPASQPIRTIDYAVKVADGEIEPDGPFDLAAGLLFGAPRN